MDRLPNEHAETLDLHFDALSARPRRDEHLFLAASARWEDCRQAFIELMADAPKDHWDAWWAERAPGTAVSRWTRATQLFRAHFDAAAQVAFAQGLLDVEQLKTLQALVDPAQNPGDPAAVTTERLGGPPVLHEAGWTAALVITAASGPVLYLPARQPAFLPFKQRSALEDHLSREQLSILADSPQHDPLLAALSRWREHHVEVQHSAFTLFATPPAFNEIEKAEEVTPLFGSLTAEQPLSDRRRVLQQQRQAIETLLDDAQGVPDATRLLALQEQLDALTRAEENARTAAVALLDRSPATRLLELRQRPNAQYDALYQARLAGLRAEAAVQRLLQHISDEEHRWLEAVLDNPKRADRTLEVMAARLSLSLSETATLDGSLVITPEAPGHSLLLYWPGSAGGLQRFDSRQALEQAVFKLHAIDTGLTLHLTPVAGDPFDYGLQSQLYACEQHVATLLADYPVPSHQEQRRVELEKRVLETVDSLGVPVHEAREQAYADILEQQQTRTLAGHLPQWLGRSSDAERARLKASITAFIAAMKRSHRLIERDLPHRDDFSHKRVDECLRRDFALTQGFSVTLDLPDSTTWQKTLLEGAAPGTPQKNVLIASEQRSRLSIAQLAHINIDQALWWRMSLMKVEVSAESATERDTLIQGLTSSYLRTLITELDLAGHYEGLIVRAFMGSSSATAFDNAHRRECLVEPFRLMLKMRGDSALLQKQIDQDGWNILSSAIDAKTANGQRIVLQPASLTVGGADTEDGATGLSGVTFIEEQISGVTLLYLPDSPDGLFLYQRATLELARQLLFDLCLRPTMVDYLAGRALKGDYSRHLSRINQARQRNFDALIGVGMPWPANTSLAAHLLNAHMGRLIEAHRATSRSNTALSLERYALQGGVMFNYLKMAMGMVPFVGSAIALYDAWDSANLAVAAFLRGEVGHGLAQLESVLLSLIDAAMDILPSVSAHTLTRQRQSYALAKGAARFNRSSLRKARRLMDRFEGYEYEGAISLAGLQPGSEGLYRNVYRHALGDFIIHQGRVYQVRLLDRTLRLFGTRRRAYQQPIAFDETVGHWDTYFAVHGTLYNQGLWGGGNLVGHLADGLEPIWPAAIRRWLPRWLIDRGADRQRRLGNTIDALSRQLDTRHRTQNAALQQYAASDDATRRLTLDAVDAGCVSDIELATQRYQRTREMLPLSHGNRRQQTQELLSQSALVVVERTIHRVDLARDRCLYYLDDIAGITEQLLKLPSGSIQRSLHLTRQMRQLRMKLIHELQGIDANLEQLDLWRRRLQVRADKASVAEDLERIDTALSEVRRDYLKTLNHLPLLTHYDRILDPAWMYLHGRMGRARTKVYDALNTQNSLPEVIANVHRRNQILGECLEVYEQFGRDLNVWVAGYGQHLDLPWVAPLQGLLEKMSNHARHGIKHGIKQAPNAKDSGKEIFETDGNRLLIGTKAVDPATRQTRFIMPGEDGRVENWLPASAGQYRRQVPSEPLLPDAVVDRKVLLTEARQRLAAQDNYRLKVDGYARQNMRPADLDYMMTSEAAELRLRARRIARVSAQEPIIAQLNTKAERLIEAGRELRIAQILNSKTPTEGYLDDLHQLATPDQPLVEIRKVGTLVDLGRRADGRPDFLQEYEVLDLTRPTPTPLWYAHFHYGSAKPVFNRFDKAHLKTPEQRNLGLKWQQKLASTGAAVDPIWRGPIGKPLAIQYFEALF
ncbi:dermonecrotic toxin domain-containing protein [Pseudomonas frederiksbergensis]|uniref:dermonecrotic toxin domain-containing protein n=1 Tax=Pseudomonas frederiksbergensis TaxID=104087 RepID=UPI003D2003C7